MTCGAKIILIMAVLISAVSCQTPNDDTLKQNKSASSGPASCEYEDIEEWLRMIAAERYSQYGNYSTYDLKIKKNDTLWTAYLSRPITNEGFYQGGGPTALLDSQNCDVIDVYMTQ